jgi:hypothetical protein
MLVIEQPDGTLTHVPEWMTEPAAAIAEVRDAPRFPLAVLRDQGNRLKRDGMPQEEDACLRLGVL